MGIKSSNMKPPKDIAMLNIGEGVNTQVKY